MSQGQVEDSATVKEEDNVTNWPGVISRISYMKRAKSKGGYGRCFLLRKEKGGDKRTFIYLPIFTRNTGMRNQKFVTYKDWEGRMLQEYGREWHFLCISLHGFDLWKYVNVLHIQKIKSNRKRMERGGSQNWKPIEKNTPNCISNEQHNHTMEGGVGKTNPSSLCIYLDAFCLRVWRGREQQRKPQLLHRFVSCSGMRKAILKLF